MSRTKAKVQGLSRRVGPILICLILALGLVIAVQIRPDPVDQQTYGQSIELTAPVAATSTQPARAAVNETYSWGLEIEGVYLKSRPVEDALALETRVVHGEVYEILCWVNGERVTNGNDQNPTDDATTFTSNLWWKIAGPHGDGFISNVWFARTTDTRLGTQQCP